VFTAHTVIEHSFVIAEPRPNVCAENLPSAHWRRQSFRSRRNRKNTDELILVEDLQKVLVRIDKNLTRGERRIFSDFAFSKLLHFKGQYIRHFQSFAGLKMLPVLSTIKFLNVRLGRMITLGDELEQGRIGQPF